MKGERRMSKNNIAEESFDFLAQDIKRKLAAHWKPYEGTFSKVTTRNWNDPKRLFFQDGNITLIDLDFLYLDNGKAAVRIPLGEIVNIVLKKERYSDD